MGEHLSKGQPAVARADGALEENMSHLSNGEVNAQDILGQFYYAFGQGAGHMRVGRSAIAALRDRYLEPIRCSQSQWKLASANVLAFVTQVGRLAALSATQAGRTAIAEVDFTAARRVVEAQVHRSADHKGVFIAGPLCPPVPGEDIAPPRDEKVDGEISEEEVPAGPLGMHLH